MDTILFDLDGTLLSMDLDLFTKQYVTLLKNKFSDTVFDEDVVMKSIFNGTKAMVKNGGDKTNEAIFWESFESDSGIKKAELEDQMIDFYSNDFQKIEEVVSVNKAIVDSVKVLKDKGYKLVCATNPLFPSVASESRLAWSGVDVEAFDYITTYEDFHFCKPNPAYFEEVLDKYNIDKSKCIMVGNDTQEDGAIKQLDIPLYLIDDCLIHRDENEPIDSTWLGSAKQFLELVQTFEDIKK